jgi:acyl transferase domain-containing protein
VSVGVTADALSGSSVDDLAAASSAAGDTLADDSSGSAVERAALVGAAAGEAEAAALSLAVSGIRSLIGD